MSLFKNFKGTVDDLLNHIDEAGTDTEINRIEDEKAVLSSEELYAYIMEEFHVEREEAIQIGNEILLEEFGKSVDILLAQGLVEIDRIGDDLQPIYKVTEFGERMLGEWRRSGGGSTAGGTLPTV